MSEMRIVDGYIISRSGDYDILPTAKEEDVVPPAGGLVLTPSNGVVDNVSVFDLKSLYPSCMITCNISPETRVDNPEDADVIIPRMPGKEADVGGEITEEDIDWSMEEGALGFSFDKEGIIPKNLKKQFKNRAEAKEKRNQHKPGSTKYEKWDRRQRGLKIVMNAHYGVMGSKYWRLAETGLGDAVTSAGRYTLWKGAQIAKERGYNVSYGDTDSVMISMTEEEEPDREEILSDSHDLEDNINSEMSEVAHNFGIDSPHPYLGDDIHGDQYSCLLWEFENAYGSFLQLGSKKRYAGTIHWKEGKDITPPEIDIAGMESNRSDTPEIVAEVQPEVIERILTGSGYEDISEYLQGITEDLRGDGRPIREFALPGTINKPLEDYPNRETPRACEYGNEHLDRTWNPGDEPWIVYVKSTPIGLPDENVLAIEWNEEVPDGFEVDNEAIIERALHKPLKPIIEEMGWDFDELRSGRRTQSITESDKSSGDPFSNVGESSESEKELPW